LFLSFQITTTFFQSLSFSHGNLQHLKKTTISLLIVNFNELNQKDQRRRKIKKATAACCHHLLQNTTTIEEGNNIVVVTFFTTKPPKKATTLTIAFFCNKTIKEGDRSCRHLLLLLNHHIQKMTLHYCRLLLLKYKEKCDDKNYHCLCYYNTAIEEDDEALSLYFSSQTQKRRQRQLQHHQRRR
jgi:hypothetical protein